MDPGKLPALRRQVWELLVEAEIHRDLGLGEDPAGEDEFDDMVLHVDGYLCALKDAQIRGGLHVLGLAPEGEALVDLVLAVYPAAPGRPCRRCGPRSPATSGSTPRPSRPVTRSTRSRPSRRAGSRPSPPGPRRGADAALDAATTHRRWRWVASASSPPCRGHHRRDRQPLAALDGRYVPAGPSGAPTRGAAHVLPTGRNFYSVDPKALPLAAVVGGRAGAGRPAGRAAPGRDGRPPTTVGLVLWGTAAMRTSGDDAAEALALLGVRPAWDDESGRVTGLEAIPLAELGRPRVDVTLRISGFFRDAFPHVVALLDDAVGSSPGWTRTPRQPGRRPAPTTPASGARRPAATAPASCPSSSGALAHRRRPGRGLPGLVGLRLRPRRAGEPAPEAMRRRFAAIEVAVKNQDNREHDIFDTDDYLQDHGGMVAAVRPSPAASPKAWFGDTPTRRTPRRAPGRGGRRVVRSRVLNPQWIDAMRRHGYKGAFELAATVDYLFGYDATAHVVEDWMYERVTQAYVGDPDDAPVLRGVEPVGAARHRRAAARSRPSRHVGRQRRGPARRWSTRCSRPRAGRKAEHESRNDPDATPSRSARGRAGRGPPGAAAGRAVDPGIGGVLLRGDKGSAKTTLARGLAGMLAGRRRSSSCRSAPPRTGCSARSTSRPR